MHVVLIGPELEENLALRYLWGALEAAGHTVQIIVFNGPHEVDSVAEQIAGSGADVAGLSMVYTRRAEQFANVATRCRHLGFEGLTIAGGHFAAFNAVQLLRDVRAIDMVAVGEGERILCDLGEAPDRLERVAGLVWRDGEQIRFNPPAAAEQDLDQLPWPPHRA